MEKHKSNYKDKKHLLKEEDIAAASANRNFLRLTHTIQISSNRQFLAITFQNTKIMETFCTEPLLVPGFNITFRLKKKLPEEKNSPKYKLPKYSGRKTRRTSNRISLPVRRHSWNPPYTYAKITMEFLTIPVPKFTKSIGYTNTYHNT